MNKRCSNIKTAATGTFLSLCLLFSILTLPVYVQDAYADVRLADIVMGESVQNRGLSISQCPSIDAEYAFVVDASGTVYFERNADTPTQIASVTKIMTAIVALDNADLSTVITVSETAAAIGESTASLQAGDTLTLDQALTALLVSSGNDAAEAIAETLGAQWATDGQTPLQAFVKKMNDAAVVLGMTNTIFENPHGLDFDEYAGQLQSTARDVATMSNYAMSHETFRNIVKQSNATVTVTRDGQPAELSLTSTDMMLEDYEGACGIKTGYTSLAGACFAGACDRGDGLVYAIVLNSSDETQRFYDCETLLDWYYEHRVSYQLAHSAQTTSMIIDGLDKTVPLVAEVAHTAWTDKTVKGTLDNYDEPLTVFDLNGNISQEVSYQAITGDVKTGDVIGTITFIQHNEVIATRDIIATEDVAAPNFFEGIGLFFNRLISNFTGEKTVASSKLYNETPLLIDKTTA